MNFRNNFFVKASYVDQEHGQYANGYPDRESALEKARELAGDTAVQDVVVLVHTARGALVRVIKGVQWFCEDELRNRHGAEWKVVEELPEDPFASVKEAPAPDGPSVGVPVPFAA